MVLTAMIFAVAMTFIDQTIVSIAAPKIQEDLGLSSSGMQWAINAYLLSLAALFAFGGRLADTVGHRRMVVLGVIIFAGSSALCGLTPRGGLAETWIVAFRAVQGLGGAIMFPAALAIVVQTFELHTRGRALAGHLLDQCARRAHRPGADRHLQAGHRASPMDYRGLALLGVFVVVEHRTASPLMNVRIFGNRAFLVENVILLVVMMAFIPVFFFVSVYGQIALGEKATQASLLILYFFLGFVVFAQIGGRMLDRTGAKRPVVLGCAMAAVGFALWAGQATDLHPGSQVIYIIIAGAGMGLMLGQANTDAVNRASRFSYGEATGITQTVCNYGASLGFAILGTVLITEFRSSITSSLVARGLPPQAASAQASKIAELQGGNGNVATIPLFIRADFAAATREVLYVMAAIMAVAGLVALRGLRRGIQEEPAAAAGPGGEVPGGNPDVDLHPSESR